jgi:hypothetical protein
MDRLIWSQIDFNHKPLSAEQRLAARKAGKKKHPPRSANSYRAAKRNARNHVERCNPSPPFDAFTRYHGPIFLNRSRHWKVADNYYDARDLSQSSREVV